MSDFMMLNADSLLFKRGYNCNETKTNKYKTKTSPRQHWNRNLKQSWLHLQQNQNKLGGVTYTNETKRKTILDLFLMCSGLVFVSFFVLSQNCFRCSHVGFKFKFYSSVILVLF